MNIKNNGTSEADMNRTLLLVDDDDNYLKSLSRIFLYEGYKIFAAASGDKAIELLEKNEIQVMCLINGCLV